MDGLARWCQREFAWMLATRNRNDLVFFAFIGAEQVAVREAYVFSDRDAPAECLLRRAPATLRRPPAMRGGWSEPCVNGAVHFNRLRCMDEPISGLRPPTYGENARLLHPKCSMVDAVTPSGEITRLAQNIADGLGWLKRWRQREINLELGGLTDEY